MAAQSPDLLTPHGTAAEVLVGTVTIWGVTVGWWHVLSLIPGLLFYIWRGWLCWRSHKLVDRLERERHDEKTEPKNDV